MSTRSSGASASEARERARHSRDPIEIVDAALDEIGAFKDALVSLGACEPDENAARRVIEAHDRGDAVAWLAAALLARIRHPIGYRKLVDILLLADDPSAGYAASGLVDIAGGGAEADLTRAIDASRSFASSTPRRGRGTQRHMRSHRSEHRPLSHS
jgi:hypothetical protein